MNRGDYNNIPNRIIAPHISLYGSNSPTYSDDVLRQMGIGPPARQPLLGNAPSSRFSSYSRQPDSYTSSTYNGPVVGPNSGSRRRGFDKGPFGEDLVRPDGRTPLLRTPKLAVERIGGDMDISRSRSQSPETRIVNARTVRDDRRKDKYRSRRSRSCSRSRSRSRDRIRERGKPRNREREKDTYLPVSQEPVRDGLVWTNDNYYEFLTQFVSLLNSQTSNLADRLVHGQRRLQENVTCATEAEKAKIVLPPDFDNSDRERMLHCDTTIDGLPAAIFYGSGYGTRSHYAKYSAAKDLIDKCHRIGVINSELHAAVGERQKLDRSFQREFDLQITKAVNAVVLLIKKMSHEVLPMGFLTLRQLDPEIIDKFKMMLRMVMIDVYYQGIETPGLVVPKALETLSPVRSRSRDSYGDVDSRRHGEERYRTKKGSEYSEMKKPKAEELIALKEKEMKEQMELELAKKRLEMEQQIRQQILEEERAKIRAELEMEKKIEMMVKQQQQYQNEKERKELEEQQKTAQMLKQVEDDFNSMVENLEKCFAEVRLKKMDHILEMIYNSATFKTIQLYSTTLTSISFEQKQQLVVDLKDLVDTIHRNMNQSLAHNSAGHQIPGVVGQLNPPMMQMNSQIGQLNTALGQINPPVSQIIPPMIQMNAPVSFPSTNIPTPSASAAPTGNNQSHTQSQIRSLTVGNMRLRVLTSTEQRRLAPGSKVIAQDMKTGNWNVASVAKVRDDKVTLAVGNTTWKKYADELYTEDSNMY
ncbi:unnamed protein product [Caenorhabditis sp. 36 PRJEB53466]|nr:unnamed protein product [Caenorhabditis sp. 36 PRJEB53466]